MKLQQLRYLCEVVDAGMNVSRAADTLHTSQPGVSKQIRMLEDELGVVLLERRSTRVTGLTKTGQDLLPAMRHILQGVDNLRLQAREAAAPSKAKLVIAATHTHARYVLPAMFKTYVERHPGVTLQMRQGNTERIVELLKSGEADVGLSSEPIGALTGISMIPCYRLGQIVIAPPRHPLLGKRGPLTLARLMPYPIITYDERFRLGRLVRDGFAREALVPNIVVGAIDSDIMKAYVEADFGVAVLLSIAFDRTQDRGLRALPATHLFGEMVCHAMTLEGSRLTRHALDFIALVQTVPVRGIVR